MTFSSRLISERKRLKLKQMELAQLAGTTKKSQIDYEHERVPAFANYLASIAKAGVDVQFLLTGQESGGPVLTPDERLILELYRQAPDVLRQAARAVLAGGGAVKHGKTVVVGRDMNGDVNM